MRTPTRIRRTAARIATGGLLTTLALGLVAAPGIAEEVAPATPGPHTIPESPVLPEDMGLPAPEDPGFSCEEWRELHEIFPGLPWAEPPECPVEDDETDEDGSDPAFPVDEIPLPDDLDEIPLPFDPGEIPLPLDPGGASDDEDDTSEEDEDATDDGTETDDEDDTDGADDTGDGSDDADEGGDESDGDAGDEPEVAGSSTEADEPTTGPTEDDTGSSDVTTAGGDETPVPTRVDAGAGGSVLTVDRQDAVLVAGLVLALGMVATGGVLLTRSTRS